MPGCSSLWSTCVRLVGGIQSSGQQLVVVPPGHKAGLRYLVLLFFFGRSRIFLVSVVSYYSDRN